eukprot:Pgem_evm1s8264
MSSVLCLSPSCMGGGGGGLTRGPLNTRYPNPQFCPNVNEGLYQSFIRNPEQVGEGYYYNLQQITGIEREKWGVLIEVLNGFDFDAIQQAFCSKGIINKLQQNDEKTIMNMKKIT